MLGTKIVQTVAAGGAAALVAGAFGGFGYFRHGELDRPLIALQLIVSAAVAIVPGLFSSSIPTAARRLLLASVDTLSLAFGLSLLVWFGGVTGAVINGCAAMALFVLSDHLATVVRLHPYRTLVARRQAGSCPAPITALVNSYAFKTEVAADLHRTQEIVYGEQLRIGMITPGENDYLKGDMLFPSKSVLLFAPGLFGLTTGLIPKILYAEGTSLRLFVLRATKTKHVQLATGVQAMYDVTNELLTLPALLRRIGFALTPSSLSLERSGAVIRARDGRLILTRLPYYHHRILLDDEGNPIWLGMDESKDRGAFFAVYFKPAITAKLVRAIAAEGEPIFRYRTVPAGWNGLLPLVDYPMASVPWADLFIRHDGTGRLFVPKDGITVAEWRMMLQKLMDLWMKTLEGVGYRLLKLTKDPQRLGDYLAAKGQILEQFFRVQEVVVAAQADGA